MWVAIIADSATFTGDVITFNEFDGLTVDSSLDLGNGVTLTTTANAIAGQFAQDLGDNGLWSVVGNANRDGSFLSSAFVGTRGEIGFSFANPVSSVGAFVNQFQAYGKTNNSMLVVAYDIDGYVLESFSVSIDTDAFGYDDLKADERLLGNNNRVRCRDWLIPLLRERLAQQSAADLAALFERHGLPFAPITQPHELLDDPHLCATGGLAPITLPDGERAGQAAQTVLLPLALDGERLGVRRSPPKLGEHTADVLRELGRSDAVIEELIARQVAAQFVEE